MEGNATLRGIAGEAAEAARAKEYARDLGHSKITAQVHTDGLLLLPRRHGKSMGLFDLSWEAARHAASGSMSQRFD